MKSVSVLIISLFVAVTVNSLCEDRYLCDSTSKSVVVDLAVECTVTHASLLDVTLNIMEDIEDFIIQYNCYDKNGTKLPNYPKTSKKYDPTSVPQLYFNIEGERCDYGGCVYDLSDDCWKILTTFASCPIQDVPDTPVNINVTDLTSRNLTLTWTEPTDNNALILGYRVFYTRPSFLGDDVNLTVDGAVEELFVDDLHPGVTYEFLILAFNKKGNGNYSDPITIATLEEEPAGFPQNLSGVIINSTAIFVTWEPVLANETNGIITMYSVVGITENPFIVNDTVLSVLFTELKEDFMYNFSVRAHTEIGFGPESPPFNIKTPIADVPDTPVNINVTDLTSRNLTLTWTEPTDNNALILGYRVFYTRPSFLGGDVNLTVDGAVEELIIDDLHPGVTYEFLILAFNKKGNGNYSDPITIATLEEEPAGFPQNLSGVIINSTAISVTWEPVLANETNGIITMYSVIGITENPFIVNDTVFSVLFTELKEDFMYNFSVRAHTEIGFGPESPPLNIRTPIADVPDTPVNINFTDLTSRNLTLTWTEPFDNYASILGYRVFYTRPSFLGGDVNLTVDGAEEELFVDDLHPGVTYEFLILAFNKKGNGNYSDPITIATLEEEPAGFPQNLSAVIMNSTAISVTWEPVLANETNGIITMYSVIGVTENPFIVNDTVLSVLFTELKEDFMYTFSVRAHTEIGFGPESPPFNIRTPKAVTLSLPTNSLTNTIVSIVVPLFVLLAIGVSILILTQKKRRLNKRSTVIHQFELEKENTWKVQCIDEISLTESQFTICHSLEVTHFFTDSQQIKEDLDDTSMIVSVSKTPDLPKDHSDECRSNCLQNMDTSSANNVESIVNNVHDRYHSMDNILLQNPEQSSFIRSTNFQSDEYLSSNYNSSAPDSKDGYVFNNDRHNTLFEGDSIEIDLCTEEKDTTIENESEPVPSFCKY